MKAGGVARIFILILAAFVFTTSCFSSDKVVSTVNMVNGDGTVLIYAGAQKGVINGDIFVVSRNGRTIGTVEVVDAQKMYCRGRITSVEPGETVKEMDAVELAERAPVVRTEAEQPAGASGEGIKKTETEEVKPKEKTDSNDEETAVTIDKATAVVDKEVAGDEEAANVDDYCDSTENEFDSDGWIELSFVNKAQVATLCIDKAVMVTKATAAVNMYKTIYWEGIRELEKRERAFAGSSDKKKYSTGEFSSYVRNDFSREKEPRIYNAKDAARTQLNNYKVQIEGMIKGLEEDEKREGKMVELLEEYSSFFVESMNMVLAGSVTLYGEGGDSGEETNKDTNLTGKKVIIRDRRYELHDLLQGIDKSSGEKRPKCKVYREDKRYYPESMSFFIGEEECEWGGHDTASAIMSDLNYLWSEYKKENNYGF